jgi:membrane-associated phospholipid phosphatase
MSFVHRFTEDQTRPTPRAALRDIAVRAIAPAIVLWAVIVAGGFFVKGPLGDLPGEDQINRVVRAAVNKQWDGVTHWWSTIGNTEIIIGTCVVAVAILLIRTRQWWLALVPALAISLQATVFVIAANLVNRSRPDVERLDPAPPTSSYPSGHTGASFALYLTFALLAQRITNRALRWAVTAVCVVIPFLVGYARVYRGMHHLLDVVVGMINGIICALLAWHYLRRTPASSTRLTSGGRGARHTGGPVGVSPERPISG